MTEWQCTNCKALVRGSADYQPGVCPNCRDPYVRWTPKVQTWSTPLIEYIRAQRNWSERTFGPSTREKGVIDHIRKELKEIEDAATPAEKLAEWIDILILGFDGAWRTGATDEQIVEALGAKQVKNFNRTWPDWRTMSEDQAIEHVRSALPYICKMCRVQYSKMPGQCASCGSLQVIPNANFTEA